MISQDVLKRERHVRLFSVIAILFLFILIIVKVENMLISFVLAFHINFLLAPFVNSIERQGIPRHLSVGAIYLITGFFVGFGTWLLLPDLSEQFVSFKNEVPKYIDGVTNLMSNTERNVNSFLAGIHKVDFTKNTESWLVSLSTRIFEDLPRIVSKSLTTIILAPFFGLFMLLDGQRMVKELLKLVPNNFFELALNLQYQVNQQIGGYIRARLLEAAIVGLVVGIGLSIIDFPYTVILGIMAALTNLIPYIGPVIGAIPGILIAIVNGMAGVDLLLVVSVYATAQLIDNLLIIPLVVAKIVNLHPVEVVVIIIIGAQVAGVLGMIISIPVANIIKLAAISVYQHFIAFRT